MKIFFDIDFCIIFYIIFFVKNVELSLAQVEEIPCGAIYMPEICRNISLESLTEIDQFEKCGPALLPIDIREYIWHGTGKEITMWENKIAFNRIRIKKRVFRDLTNHTLETTVLGRRVAFPLGISPTIGQYFVHPEGEIGAAKASASMQVIYIHNSWSGTLLEEVAESVPKEAILWMHTYFHLNKQIVVNVVKRAELAGYAAIVVTVDDSPVLELRCGGKRYYNTHSRFPNLAPNDILEIDYYSTLKGIAWLKNITKLPIVVKGIMTTEDAILAIEAGASAIMVSNEGGRTLDGTTATIDVLPDIVDTIRALHPEVEVYIDSGVRSGADVYKALAMGARAAFIGRPAIWGLTIGGEKGVSKVLQIMKEGFEETMLHAGFSSPLEIPRNSLIHPKTNLNCKYFT